MGTLAHEKSNRNVAAFVSAVGALSSVLARTRRAFVHIGTCRYVQSTALVTKTALALEVSDTNIAALGCAVFARSVARAYLSIDQRSICGTLIDVDASLFIIRGISLVTGARIAAQGVDARRIRVASVLPDKTLVDVKLAAVTLVPSLADARESSDCVVAGCRRMAVVSLSCALVNVRAHY
jgi:hypothetical protein